MLCHLSNSLRCTRICLYKFLRNLVPEFRDTSTKFCLRTHEARLCLNDNQMFGVRVANNFVKALVTVFVPRIGEEKTLLRINSRLVQRFAQDSADINLKNMPV